MGARVQEMGIFGRLESFIVDNSGMFQRADNLSMDLNATTTPLRASNSTVQYSTAQCTTL